jgi:hypothetical protein
MTRKSVPTKGVHEWWLAGWQYVMPDFDNPEHSIIEWTSEKEPAIPETQPRSEDERTAVD